MTDLSPATHAVIDAYVDAPVSGRIALAAALRAAADQLGYEVLGVRCVDCSQIALIATELEALPE